MANKNLALATITATGRTVSRTLGARLKETQTLLDFANAVDATGFVDCSTAMLAAVNAAVAAAVVLPYSLEVDRRGMLEIVLPPGTFLITADKGMLGTETITNKIFGLRFRGAGKGITRIVFKPTSAGSLMENNYWQGLQFKGISFYAATAGCTGLFTNTSQSAQEVSWDDCEHKFFKYPERIQSTDNASEFNHHNHTYDGTEAAGANFFIGGSGTVDQSLNYKWSGMTKFLNSSAPFYSLAKGGHVTIDHLDISNWGGALAGPTTVWMFQHFGTTHNAGVCASRVTHSRFEAKSNYAGLCYSEWPYGTVDIHDDVSSQQGSFTYPVDFISLYFAATDGAAYRFTGILAGGITIRQGNDYANQHRILVENGMWCQRESPSDAVTYDNTRVSFGTLTCPTVEFRNMRPFSGAYTDAMGTGGVAVWDATIGFLGEAVQCRPRRRVTLKAYYGLPSGSEAPRLLLPVGALIRKITALAPVGASPEGDGGTYTLKTTEGSPATIGACVISGAMSSGFLVETVITPPFECSTTAKARVQLVPTSVATSIPKGLFEIEGDW